ncbi:HNH endonuclease [Salmonella enterica]|nr:hypothetical protein [Salmonella enterica]EGJ8345357.1 hypothetical protein [Salmonella enterica subsp. enterica serovar Panama]EHG7081404.1 hypothetical protein [Salmonella enterica subsp. enterica serovar Sandiego]EJK8277503.1 HNH endonuclease [Salmonella enterica subsp. enterica serovar India]EGC5696621.1 hypothetical protein [Salmonella enterica]
MHQLVWLYHHGSIPPMLDHINRDPRDCRIENLRVCNNAQNQYNIAKRRHNTSGFKGVVFHPNCPRKPWQAKIVIRGRVKSLGYFPTKELAAEAYAKGAKLYAGEFASSL